MSDIPNYNITYLDRDLDGVNFILQPNNPKRPIKSFAANITDLLSHSFFLKSSLLGDFAKEKIDTVIKWLNRKILEKEISQLQKQKDFDKKILLAKRTALKDFETLPDFDKEYVVQLINIVDEPLLKYKMEEMYHTIYPKELNREDVIAQIQSLAKKSGLNVNFD